MKTIFILFLFFISGIFAQDEIVSELMKLTEAKQYDKIIELHSSKSKDYSSEALYYIGQAYYFLSSKLHPTSRLFYLLLSHKVKSRKQKWIASLS